MPGQFLERPTLIPVESFVLEGLSHRGAGTPPLLVLPPGSEGGGMDHVVGAELAWAAASAGFRTLRFNYRGIGASQGVPGDPAARLEDALAALRVLEENAGISRVAAVALGGSAPTALELCRLRPGIAGLCLVSPRELEPSALLGLQIAPLLIVGQEERQRPRAALAAAAAEAGGSLVVIPGADAGFMRNLTQVGQEVVAWLRSLGAGDSSPSALDET